VRAMYRTTSKKNNAYFTKTLAEAEAISGELATDATKTAAGVIGYHANFTLDSTSRTFTYTNHSAVTPSMAGISISYSGDGDTSNWDAVYGYDAAPEAVVLDEIEYLIQQRMSSGQALDGYKSASIQKAPEDVKIMSRSPNIVAATVEISPAETAATKFGWVGNMALVLGTLGTDVGGPLAYQQLQRDAGAVRSIIFDEHRTLTGLVDETVYVATDGPGQSEGEEEPYITATVRGLARVFAMHSDG